MKTQNTFHYYVHFWTIVSHYHIKDIFRLYSVLSREKNSQWLPWELKYLGKLPDAPPEYEQFRSKQHLLLLKHLEFFFCILVFVIDIKISNSSSEHFYYQPSWDLSIKEIGLNSPLDIWSKSNASFFRKSWIQNDNIYVHWNTSLCTIIKNKQYQAW